MVADPAATLAHVADLERRDAAVADELDGIREIARRASAVRGRGDVVRNALQRIPRELEELIPRLADAESDVTRARGEVERAEEQLASLERSRRRREDDIDRATRELGTARQELADAEHRLDRLVSEETALLGEEAALREEALEVVRVARGVAGDLQRIDRVTESARADPGETLESLEEWGALARSALFVVHGTLETERERIVLEANALGEAVLGESLGVMSVSAVRGQIEERLRS